jgi:hypothetical protein
VRAIAAFVRPPSASHQYIKWSADVPFESVERVIAEQPPALQLARYLEPHGTF